MNTSYGSVSGAITNYEIDGLSLQNDVDYLANDFNFIKSRLKNDKLNYGYIANC